MMIRGGPAAPETAGPKNIDPPGTRIDVARVARRSDIAVSLGRRREAALRCPPLASGVRDPLDGRVQPFGTAPSTFGLSGADLVAEIAARRRDGWENWELRARFTDPREVAA